MGVFSRRRRKWVAPLTLALWSFALFVGIVHACGLDQDLGHQAPSRMMDVGIPDTSHNDGTSPACEKFCADDFPLLAKVKAVQDPPTGQVLLGPGMVGESSRPIIPQVSSLFSSPRPPPGIDINTRFVRLAL